MASFKGIAVYCTCYSLCISGGCRILQRGLHLSEARETEKQPPFQNPTSATVNAVLPRSPGPSLMPTECITKYGST